jgi:hypothetical protein
MTRAETRALVRRLIADNPNRPNSDIGRDAGVSHHVVARVRAESSNETSRAKSPNGAQNVQCKTSRPNTENVQPETSRQNVQPETSGSGQIVDLAYDLVKAIAAKVPQDRRGALVRALLLASTPEQPPGHWRCRTTPKQRADLLALCAGGMPVTDVARQAGINYRTAASQVRRARAGK